MDVNVYRGSAVWTRAGLWDLKPGLVATHGLSMLVMRQISLDSHGEPGGKPVSFAPPNWMPHRPRSSLEKSFVDAGKERPH